MSNLFNVLTGEVIADPFKEAVSTLNFEPLMNNYMTVIGLMLPVIVAIAAVKKGVLWLIGFIYRA